MVHPSPYLTISTRNKHRNLKNYSANNKLDHPVPNNILFISVFAVLIYVRSHVNVPFHLLQLKIIMLHQYLLEKIVRVHHPSIPHPIIVVKKCEVLIDFLLSTDHLRRYLFERDFLDIKPRPIDFPKFSFFLLLFPFLFPLTLATKVPSTSNLDLFLFTNHTSPLFLNLSSQKPSWHAGCCKDNQTMCDSVSSSISSHGIYISNDTSSGIFLFDGANQTIDHHHFFFSNDYTSNYDFLNNQTLFCQRYNVFDHLLSKHLAIFTSFIFVIGIIFNSFVFLVLMRGSLRRSTSFTLFVALTCFDLLSLASSLFSTLFRTFMKDLRNSPTFCKMFGIIFLYFRQCSSTTLLLIAIERCIVIKHPLCRYIFGKLRLPLLAFIMFIYAVPIPFDFIFYTKGALHCEAFDTVHAHRYQIFRGFFTVFSYAIIPFVGIAISNLLIIIELKNSKKRFISKEDNGKATHVSNK
jgi:hypothetical protein